MARRHETREEIISLGQRALAKLDSELQSLQGEVTRDWCDKYKIIAGELRRELPERSADGDQVATGSDAVDPLDGLTVYEETA